MTILTNPAQKPWPEHAAAHNTHQRVLDMIGRLLPTTAGSKALDVPCGAGALSARLAASGLNVTSVDIEAVEPFRHDPKQRVLANADQGLPFPDQEFNLVLSVEGIEHLENPSAFLRECARVTSHDGLVIISTPNVDSFRSRRWALLRGHPRFFGPQGEAHKDSGHLHGIDMIFFRGAAARAGLEIIDVAVNDIDKSSVSELLRPWLTRRLPPVMQGEIPFYGDVVIYGLRKKNVQTAS